MRYAFMGPMETIHLNANVEILSRNDAIPHQPPALVEQSILHPIEDESRHLPRETDRALPDLSHEGSSPSLHLSACPWSWHKLNHRCVVRRVARVSHYELTLVLHQV